MQDGSRSPSHERRKFCVRRHEPSNFDCSLVASSQSQTLEQHPPWNRQSLLQTDQSIIKYLSLLLASAAAAAAAVLTTETVEARFPLCLPDAATTTATATAVTAMPRMWCQVKPFPIPFDLQRQDTPDNNTWTRI